MSLIRRAICCLTACFSRWCNFVPDCVSGGPLTNHTLASVFLWFLSIQTAPHCSLQATYILLSASFSLYSSRFPPQAVKNQSWQRSHLETLSSVEWSQYLAQIRLQLSPKEGEYMRLSLLMVFIVGMTRNETQRAWSERLLLIPGLAPADSNCFYARSVVDQVEAKPQRKQGNENMLNCESCYGKKWHCFISPMGWIRACKP